MYEEISSQSDSAGPKSFGKRYYRLPRPAVRAPEKPDLESWASRLALSHHLPSGQRLPQPRFTHDWKRHGNLAKIRGLGQSWRLTWQGKTRSHCATTLEIKRVCHSWPWKLAFSLSLEKNVACNSRWGLKRHKNKYLRHSLHESLRLRSSPRATRVTEVDSRAKFGPPRWFKCWEPLDMVLSLVGDTMEGGRSDGDPVKEFGPLCRLFGRSRHSVSIGSMIAMTLQNQREGWGIKCEENQIGWNKIRNKGTSQDGGSKRRKGGRLASASQPVTSASTSFWAPVFQDWLRVRWLHLQIKWENNLLFSIV